MYVPAADRIAAAINRSLFGLLLACLDRLGEGVRAYEGHLQPRGTSPPCCNSAFEATEPDFSPAQQHRPLPHRSLPLFYPPRCEVAYKTY